MTDDRPRRPRPRLLIVGGNQLHVDTCARTRRVPTVEYDPPGDSMDVARDVHFTGLKPCHICKPIRRLANWERFG